MAAPAAAACKNWRLERSIDCSSRLRIGKVMMLLEGIVPVHVLQMPQASLA